MPAWLARAGVGAGASLLKKHLKEKGKELVGKARKKAIAKLAKKTKTKKKEKKKEKKKRDWPEVRLNDRKEGLAEEFLEEHGYEHSSTSGKPNTYTYDQDGKVKAYAAFTNKGKHGVSVKTFNNPTLKSLRNWMGY